ncbi:hypothetical protein [Gluconacetobacter takamatsuzukensis]|uniref:Mannosyltransferase PIG-V n=1 Tax=Gluconacetobacter takamatsuzukensis TaxID=1286190 RepID=A0A7W4PNN7_9PROT|nr:hypothetical protein [Gluconacetobacter takamatsuzukensis]MBB2204787.1 hypothetical protein [Gluconacetobacter takamatsuzukensis]
MAGLFAALRRLSAASSAGLVVVMTGVCAITVVLKALLALPWGGLVAASCQWDCFWYSDIVRNGYSRLPRLDDPLRLAQANWAFFPLYPLLARAVGSGLHLDAVLAEILVNILLWPVLIFLCLRDLELRGLGVDRLLFVLFFVLYPFNVWYMVQYSEALYGVLLMAAIVALRQEQVALAALACALLALARPTGFVMAVCLAGWWLASGVSVTRASMMVRVRESLLLVVAGGAGLSVFVLYLFHLTGDGFGFVHVETAWGREFHFFLLHVLYALDSVLIPFGIYALAAFALVWRMCTPVWALSALLVGTTTLLATSTSVVSVERYALGNPLVIQFLAYMVISLPPRARGMVMAGMGVLSVRMLLLWYSGSYLVM